MISALLLASSDVVVFSMLETCILAKKQAEQLIKVKGTITNL